MLTQNYFYVLIVEDDKKMSKAIRITLENGLKKIGLNPTFSIAKTSFMAKEQMKNQFFDLVTLDDFLYFNTDSMELIPMINPSSEVVLLFSSRSLLDETKEEYPEIEFGFLKNENPAHNKNYEQIIKPETLQKILDKIKQNQSESEQIKKLQTNRRNLILRKTARKKHFA